MIKVFIDGREGTTGLRIEERLAVRGDIELLNISEQLRKSPEERGRLISMSDFTFLCLPDDAARESVSLCGNPDTVIIDASTAHRTHPDWAYGLPELSEEYRQRIITSKRVAVPGCHATGFCLIVRPLVQLGIMPADYPVTCHSVTGYSGGGKKMIAEYTGSVRPAGYDSPRQYGLTIAHKHIPEMKYHCGLAYEPLFSPIVADFYAGMVVSVPLHTRLLSENISCERLWEIFAEHYAGSVVNVRPFGGDTVGGYLDASTAAGSDGAELFVFGGGDRLIVSARFDNLGKGASGAAVQCMDLIINNR